MGLDAVEIVMEVEEAFDIRLEDAEMVKVWSIEQSLSRTITFTKLHD